MSLCLTAFGVHVFYNLETLLENATISNKTSILTDKCVQPKPNINKIKTSVIPRCYVLGLMYEHAVGIHWF